MQGYHQSNLSLRMYIDGAGSYSLKNAGKLGGFYAGAPLREGLSSAQYIEWRRQGLLRIPAAAEGNAVCGCNTICRSTKDDEHQYRISGGA